MEQPGANRGARDAAARQGPKISTEHPCLTESPDTTQARSWRDVLPIHPAAALFPLMSADELDALAADIKQHGLRNRITLWKDGDWEDEAAPIYLLDGRNRLDALELAGICRVTADRELLPEWTWEVFCGPARPDPYALAISFNIQRRHLTPEQRRDLIAKLIKQTPDKSDRQIAETVKASPTTVGTIRKEMEQTGDVSKLDTRTDSRGRKQPANKPPTKPSPAVSAAADRAERRAEETRHQQEAAAAPPADPRSPDDRATAFESQLRFLTRCVGKLNDWLETKPVLTDDAKSRLVGAFHDCAAEYERLAQHIIRYGGQTNAGASEPVLSLPSDGSIPPFLMRRAAP